MHLEQGNLHWQIKSLHSSSNHIAPKGYERNSLGMVHSLGIFCVSILFSSPARLLHPVRDT
ncbi:hypothetical protein BDR03DRAFT_952641 [Suillus americanus]|nr:hypothetical protein BDR03DRAFT_952641 [Suillus americanus]